VPAERLLRSPFGIDPQLYNDLLDWKVPVTFAACYIVTVFFLNAYNRSRKHKPWWISTTRFFKTFVVLHNVFLAAFSLITFIATFRAIGRVLPEFSTSTPPAYFVDALCKIQGPRGLGDAVTYNTTLNIWETKNSLIHLAQNGTPDPTDVGRLWGEGLAFWGWFFYLSKFYEVLDTLIILAKGKRSPTLQTYHHAGAMLCMWAGIRYMSPPIWMFVFINSFIHSLMVSTCEEILLHVEFANTLAVRLLHFGGYQHPRPSGSQTYPHDDANHAILGRCNLRNSSPVCPVRHPDHHHVQGPSPGYLSSFSR